MTRIEELIKRLKSNWSVAKNATDQLDFKLRCSFASKGTVVYIDSTIPDDIRNFWEVAASADLFLDVEYGQWGLHIFSIDQAIETTRHWQIERPEDFLPTDFILGNFIGDSDLLVICRNPENYGNVLIALPIDGRNDWYKVADNFTEFLERYALAEGNKFWEG